jgi:uncharacterized protein DUF4185
MPDVVRDKTRKVVQLVGEIDRQPGGHAPQTFTKWRLYGTDLGTPLDFGRGHELWFLFGDAWTAEKRADGSLVPKISDGKRPLEDKDALMPPYNSFHPFNADPVGVARSNITAESLSGMFELIFRHAPDGDYATLEMPGVSLLTNKVPTGAINTPSGVYVFATGKRFRSGDEPGGVGAQCSWVARWSDLTTLKTEPPYHFSTGRFANYLVPVVGGVNDGTGTPGHPTAGEVVWLWGTGFPNRQSCVRLAYVPLGEIGNWRTQKDGDIEQRVRDNAWRFFCKTDRGDLWVKDEWKATPLFDCPSVGEFSVAWNQYLGLWLMLYGNPDPRGILCRWANKPWGPWSKGIIIFEPWQDNGYHRFMHLPNPAPRPGEPDPNPDGLSDIGRENDPGGEYAPIIIPRYTLGSGRSTTIRYTMSIWNPYTVVIMESELRLRREGIFGIVAQAFENALARVLSWIGR